MKLFILFALLSIQIGFAQPVQPFFSHSSLQTPQISSSSPLQGTDLSGLGEKKNVTLATGLSLLLPGLGEYYAGDYSTGKYLSIAEGALWITWASFRMYGDWVQSDARDFAVQHAGASINDKSDQYFIDIGNFVSADAYNQQALQDRNAYRLYINSADVWKWDTDNNREQYRQLRVQSDRVFNNSNFVITAIVANHVISAINAARTAISHNKALTETGGLQIEASPMGSLVNPHGVMFSARYGF